MENSLTVVQIIYKLDLLSAIVLFQGGWQPPPQVIQEISGSGAALVESFILFAIFTARGKDLVKRSFAQIMQRQAKPAWIDLQQLLPPALRVSSCVSPGGQSA